MWRGRKNANRFPNDQSGGRNAVRSSHHSEAILETSSTSNGGGCVSSLLQDFGRITAHQSCVGTAIADAGPTTNEKGR